MGFTLRFLLGFVLALICSSLADENATKVEEIGEIKANTTLLTGNNLPKTDSSEDLTKLQKSEPYKKETTLSRSIDIDKYTSEDFHNRNNVYNIPVSPENEKFINSDFGFQVTTHRIPEHSKEFFDSHVDDELTTPKSAIFDHKFKEAVESVDQELEHIDEESHEFPESKDNLTLSEMYEATNKNDTKAELNYLNYKNIVANKTDEKNALHKGVEVEAGTNLDFQSSFSNTQIVDEKDDGNDTVEVETSTAKVEASTAKVETSTVKVETSTVKSFILTTKKSLILTKPPNTRNESHISILSNKIETDTVKPTDKPKIVTEASFNKTEQQVEENKVVPIHVEAPITATEPTSTILPETTTKLIETTTFSEELLTETATTEAATTEWFESTPEAIVGNWTTTTQELPTTTTTPETSTTAIETTTLKTEQLTTIINEVTENQTTVEPLKATTTEDSIMPEDSAEDIDEEDNRTTPDIIDVVPYTTFTPDFKIFQRIATETETPTENATTPDVDELSRPPEDNTGTIAAITISSIGAVCLVLLAGLLYIMKKRQKRFNYGQRCTPVGLDDYSMDNVSVYNSVRRKGAMRSSKRSYGNPAFEDPTSVSHPLNFPALSKFSTNFEDMNAEFEEVPQIHARTNELPEGCDTKNRYANVIPLPETRVFLTVIESCPNSDYINANYVTGPKNIKSYYIACQAPMQNTVDDFWRMIWEQQSKVVLMVTHLFENGVEKCFDYLPPSEVLDCHRLFGDFQVTLKKREVKDKYVISILQLKNMVSNSWREIIHFWYIGWPEKGVPSEANSLIAFLIEARSHIKSSSIDRKQVTNLSNGTTKNEVNPVVVHCSPGTGRTGVVIACDIAIREFEQTRLVDIPRIVYRIRRDRASSVQTKEQYAFIYKVVCLYAAKLTGGALDSL